MIVIVAVLVIVAVAVVLGVIGLIAFLYRVYTAVQESKMLNIYTHVDVTVEMCTQPCSNGGTCVADNTCQCTEQWEGLYCDIPSELATT